MKTEQSLVDGPMLPLLIPSAPGEAGEEFPGKGRVRELSLAEASEMLNGKPELSQPALAKILQKARVIVWQSRLAVFVGDRKLAPWVRWFVITEGESGIGRCPWCGNWFVKKRPDQVFDTIAHRERHRVARWRAAGGGKKKLLTETLFLFTLLQLLC